jgi:hypothetical protein
MVRLTGMKLYAIARGLTDYIDCENCEKTVRVIDEEETIKKKKKMKRHGNYFLLIGGNQTYI